MLIDFFLKGGPIMWPILLCSIIAFAIFLERLVALRKKRIMPKEFVIEIEDLLAGKKFSEALTSCKKNESAISRILFSGISSHGRGRDIVKEKIQDTGKREAEQLSKYIDILGAVVAIAPLLGLLGTVLGLVGAFDVIGGQGTANTFSLAQEISTAILTTAFGLFVAIPALAIHRYFLSRVGSLVSQMEELSLRLVDYLQ